MYAAGMEVLLTLAILVVAKIGNQLPAAGIRRWAATLGRTRSRSGPG